MDTDERTYRHNYFIFSEKNAEETAIRLIQRECSDSNSAETAHFMHYDVTRSVVPPSHKDFFCGLANPVLRLSDNVRNVLPKFSAMSTNASGRLKWIQSIKRSLVHDVDGASKSGKAAAGSSSTCCSAVAPNSLRSTRAMAATATLGAGEQQVPTANELSTTIESSSEKTDIFGQRLTMFPWEAKLVVYDPSLNSVLNAKRLVAAAKRAARCRSVKCAPAPPQKVSVSGQSENDILPLGIAERVKLKRQTQLHGSTQLRIKKARRCLLQKVQKVRLVKNDNGWKAALATDSLVQDVEGTAPFSQAKVGSGVEEKQYAANSEVTTEDPPAAVFVIKDEVASDEIVARVDEPTSSFSAHATADSPRPDCDEASLDPFQQNVAEVSLRSSANSPMLVDDRSLQASIFGSIDDACNAYADAIIERFNLPVNRSVSSLGTVVAAPPKASNQRLVLSEEVDSAATICGTIENALYGDVRPETTAANSAILSDPLHIFTDDTPSAIFGGVDDVYETAQHDEPLSSSTGSLSKSMAVSAPNSSLPSSPASTYEHQHPVEHFPLRVLSYRDALEVSATAMVEARFIRKRQRPAKYSPDKPFKGVIERNAKKARFPAQTHELKSVDAGAGPIAEPINDNSNNQAVDRQSAPAGLSKRQERLRKRRKFPADRRSVLPGCSTTKRVVLPTPPNCIDICDDDCQPCLDRAHVGQQVSGGIDRPDVDSVLSLVKSFQPQTLQVCSSSALSPPTSGKAARRSPPPVAACKKPEPIILGSVFHVSGRPINLLRNFGPSDWFHGGGGVDSQSDFFRPSIPRKRPNVLCHNQTIKQRMAQLAQSQQRAAANARPPSPKMDIIRFPPPQYQPPPPPQSQTQPLPPPADISAVETSPMASVSLPMRQHRPKQQLRPSRPSRHIMSGMASFSPASTSTALQKPAAGCIISIAGECPPASGSRPPSTSASCSTTTNNAFPSTAFSYCSTKLPPKIIPPPQVRRTAAKYACAKTASSAAANSSSPRSQFVLVSSSMPSRLIAADKTSSTATIPPQQKRPVMILPKPPMGMSVLPSSTSLLPTHGQKNNVTIKLVSGKVCVVSNGTTNPSIANSALQRPSANNGVVRLSQPLPQASPRLIEAPVCSVVGQSVASTTLSGGSMTEVRNENSFRVPDASVPVCSSSTDGQSSKLVVLNAGNGSVGASVSQKAKVSPNFGVKSISRDKFPSICAVNGLVPNATTLLRAAQLKLQKVLGTAFENVIDMPLANVLKEALDQAERETEKNVRLHQRVFAARRRNATLRQRLKKSCKQLEHGMRLITLATDD